MNNGAGREEYLIKGHNGLETCVILSEEYALFAKRKLMERETVKEVLSRFNQAGVRYCLVGGLAMAHHSIPRQTQDMDLLVLPEDLPLVGQLLQGHQVRGTAVVLIFQIGATRIDILPANLRAKREAVFHAIEDVLDEVPVRVANLRDLILLKMLAAPERPELGRRLRDEADVVELIEFNPGRVSPDEIAYVCRSLLALAYIPDDVRKYSRQIEWLNDVLNKLGLPDHRYPLTV
jgi:hypothetical protein